MTRIVDTSVVVKWFVAEEGQDAAEALIGEALVAPDLLLAEVSNAAWKKWRRGEIGTDQARLAQTMATSFVELMPSAQLAAQALSIAMELEHPVYDCFFLAMSEIEELPLITADRRLLLRCEGTRFVQRLQPLQ